MRFKLVLLTIGIAGISAICAQDSRGNRSDEKEAPVYSYIYEIKDERDGDARTSTRSLDSPYALAGTDDRPGVTGSDYPNDDKLDTSLSNEYSAEEQPLTIELLDSAQSESEDASQSGAPARLIQPYIVDLDSQESMGESLETRSYEDTSTELQRTARTSQNSDQSLENITDESEDSFILNSSESQYTGSFGARVRPGFPHIRNSLRNRTKAVEEHSEDSSEPRKKKVFHNPIKIQSRDNVYRSLHTLRKNLESQKSRVEDENSQQLQVSSNENTINGKNSRSKPEEEVTTERAEVESTQSTGASTSILVDARFSKPIVVPDIPRQIRYTYTSTPDPEENSVPSTLKPSVTKSKNSVLFNYHQLSPLQAGLALLSSSEINNTSENTEILTNDDVSGNDQGLTSDKQEVLSDQVDPQLDQVLEQQEITDDVTQKVPAHPVEIQKSVEIYHTAPIQEIHYPVEFVPNIQKVPRERRPVQPSFNIYKSNEILDEKINQNNIRPNQESNRYEFGVDSDFKRSPITKANLVDEQLSQAASSLNQDQYSDIIYEFNPQRPKSVDQEEPIKPVREYNYEFQKLLPPVAQDQIHQTKAEGAKVEGIDNIDQPRKVPQFLVSQYPVEKVVEKTVHVPHAIAIEKLVEQKVPYPVEKVIEKQVMIPHPIPIHIQVPVDRIVEKQIRIPHIYPIHIEKVVEKKIPYAIPRFVVPQYPLHLNGPHNNQGPIEKVHIPRSYLVDVEKSERTRAYQDVPKFLKLQAHFPGHAQYEKSHQLSRGQDKAHYQPGVPTYRPQDDSQANSTQYSDQVYSNGYGPVHQVVLTRHPMGQLPRKYAFGTHYYPYSMLNAAQSYRRRGEKEHAGQLAQVYIQPKNFQYSSIEAQNGNGGNAVSSRRARQESSQGNIGSFKQSKMEYGFKPPMVPSVQYDEKTASKVE